MAVRELDYLCWVLDEPGEDGEDGVHFESAARAQAAAESGETARQMAAPCSVVTCDTPGCGEELESADEGWTVHLANPADAHNCAIIEGWTVRTDGTLSCCFDCTSACWTPVACPSCGNSLPPRGRSVPLAMGGIPACCDAARMDSAVNPRHLWNEDEACD